MNKKFSITDSYNTLHINGYGMRFFFDCPLAALYVGTMWGTHFDYGHKFNAGWQVHTAMAATLKSYSSNARRNQS